MRYIDYSKDTKEQLLKKIASRDKALARERDNLRYRNRTVDGYLKDNEELRRQVRELSFELKKYKEGSTNEQKN